MERRGFLKSLGGLLGLSAVPEVESPLAPITLEPKLLKCSIRVPEELSFSHYSLPLGPFLMTQECLYEEEEESWLLLWRKTLEQVGQLAQWKTPWLNTAFADGTPCRDGNPIFSAIHESGRFGVRVIQLDPGGSPEEFTSWTDVFAKGELEEVEELVIFCTLTQETLSKARTVLDQFVGKLPLTRAKPLS